MVSNTDPIKDRIMIDSQYFLDQKIKIMIPTIHDLYFFIDNYYARAFEDREIIENGFIRDMNKFLDLIENYYLKDGHYNLPSKNTPLEGLAVIFYHTIMDHIIKSN